MATFIAPVTQAGSDHERKLLLKLTPSYQHLFAQGAFAAEKLLRWIGKQYQHEPSSRTDLLSMLKRIMAHTSISIRSTSSTVEMLRKA